MSVCGGGGREEMVISAVANIKSYVYTHLKCPWLVNCQF